MVPKSTKAARGIPPRPASPALSYYSYDDDHTLYSSDSDAYSFSNVSTDSFSSIDTYANMRPFRLPKNQEQPSYAYEGWCLYLSPDDREVIRGSKILGFDVYQEYDQFRPHVNVSSEVYEQSELMDMHINALKRYDAKHKRCLPTRLLLGKGRKYEDELDERVRRLPNAIQDELNRLLADREDSSSNRFHYRAWEVVLMREQLHRRFADAEPTVAKKHRLRFWKNKGTETHPIEYFFIIRGRETRTPDDPNKGFKTYRRFDNPWEKSDAAEIRSRNRALWQKRRVERRGRYRRARAYRETRPPPRIRSRSPPATYRSRPSYPRRYPSLSPGPFHRTPMAPPPPPPPPPAPAMPNYGLYPPALSGPYVQRPPFFPTQPPPFPGPNNVNPQHPPYSPYAYPGYASATGPCGNPFGQRPAVSVTSGINGLSSTLPSYYPPGIPAPSWSPGHDPLQSARCTVCLTTLPCIHRPGYGGIPPPPPPIPQVRAPAVPRSCLNPRGPCMFLSGCALHPVREVPPANPPKFSGIPAARPPASVKHVSVEPTVNKIPRRPRSADSIRSRSRSRSPPSRPKLVEIESDEDQSIIEA